LYPTTSVSVRHHQTRNQLHYGDNLDVLERHIKDESIDLIYLDPPFQSGRDYNVLFEEQDGTKAAAQIQAFEDTWTWDKRAAAAYDEVVKANGVKFGRKPILTPHQQKEARKRLEAGETQRSVARSYNVSQSTISRLAP
jgi:16S rRNA G966 N2-methylase RsmD